MSIYTGEVRAYDVVRMLQRDGHPTPLGEAIASYGRIFKTCTSAPWPTEEPYRRDIKAMRNLQEGRHALAGKIFHGKKGELYQRYHEGMEDQLGALGLILNCVVLWNTRYINAALDAAARTGLPGARRGRRPAIAVHPRAHQRGREVQLPAPGPWRGRHPRTA